MCSEKREKGGDWVGSRDRVIGRREEAAAEEAEYCGGDAVQAVKGEGVGGAEEETAGRCAEPVLLLEARSQIAMGSG